MDKYKHQSVRDLAWVVSSPPLILQRSHPCLWPQAKWFQQIARDTLPWLAIIDEDPAELEALIAGRKDRRLGKYYETLWFYWLSHSKRYDIVENNIQIIIDGETLGEIDFVLFDNVTRQTVHLEVAIKFYLGAGDTREMCHWHGPNLRDRLDIKVQHLRHRQSLISKDQRVSGWLNMQGIQIDQCAVIFKGRLYYPWDYLQDYVQNGHQITSLMPAEGASEHLFSWWMTLNQMDKVFDKNQRFIPLINKGWLERIPTPCEEELLDKKAVIDAVSNRTLRLPLHLQLCNPHDGLDRVFVVDESWPNGDA